MTKNQEDTPIPSTSEIRIKRVNTEKTRKDVGSDTVYHVYFELSGHPPPEWCDIFGREWKALNLTGDAAIDGGFLLVHCQLEEVASTQLPALKKTVAQTNEAYREYAQKEATALENREDAWKLERQSVEAMAAALRFE
jgi:hypothetical protein